MNKVTRILLAVGLILAVATPALAEFKLNGYYRLMGYAAEVRSGGGTTQGGAAVAVTNDEEGDSRTMIDQRLRLMLTNTFNENVSLVYFAEIDTPWGETGKAGAGQGGMVGTDGVNVETKMAYLDLKFGDTAARLGLQGLADSYEGIAFNDDMAGAAVTHKMGNTTLMGAYSKWDEGVRSDFDDRDFYVVDLKQKFSDAFKAGASVYFLDDNSFTNDTDDVELFYYGVNADARFGVFGVNGFFMLQDGEYTDSLNSANDTDIQAMAASIKANMKLENGDIGLRVIYFSEADDDDEEGAWQGFQGQYDFPNENLMQFLTDKFVCNYGKERYATNEAVRFGYGLLGFVASGNHKLPSNMYLNWGAGYFMAMDDEAYDDPTTEMEGDTLGYEVAARFGKKYFDKVDVSLNASYAGYGDFYDNTAANGDDPDATYKAYLMVNVPF